LQYIYVDALFQHVRGRPSVQLPRALKSDSNRLSFQSAAPEQAASDA